MGLPVGLSPCLPLLQKHTAFCTILVQYKIFRINTCKSVSKQATLTSFRMSTYKKQGEGACKWQQCPNLDVDRQIVRQSSPGPSNLDLGRHMASTTVPLTGQVLKPTMPSARPPQEAPARAKAWRRAKWGRRVLF